MQISTLYDLITKAKNLDFNYLKEIKEYEFFKPLIEIKEIEADPFRDIVGYIYSKEQIIKMILFVVNCYTKESPYMKLSDTAMYIKKKVLYDLNADIELTKRILEYKIPELEKVIQGYVRRENDEALREILIAKDIYERNLYASSSANNDSGDIDIKKQKEYYQAAQEFKSIVFRLKQQFAQKEFMHIEMVKEFTENVKASKLEDLVP
jgi:hypothetical protein